MGNDMIDFEAARAKMVDGQIRTTDVTSHSVLSAFLSVPREAFVPDNLKALAYIDEDIQVAPGRYLMDPSPLAKLLQLAEIGRSELVLKSERAPVMSRLCSDGWPVRFSPLKAMINWPVLQSPILKSWALRMSRSFNVRWRLAMPKKLLTI